MKMSGEQYSSLLQVVLKVITGIKYFFAEVKEREL